MFISLGIKAIEKLSDRTQNVRNPLVSPYYVGGNYCLFSDYSLVYGTKTKNVQNSSIFKNFSTKNLSKNLRTATKF